jgi:hypothetical protein
LEIEAESPAGFDDADIGVVRDNARQLRFNADSTAFSFQNPACPLASGSREISAQSFAFASRAANGRQESLRRRQRQPMPILFMTFPYLPAHHLSMIAPNARRGGQNAEASPCPAILILETSELSSYNNCQS